MKEYIFLALLFLSFHLSESQHPTPLTTFFSATKGQNWKTSTGWLENQDFCTWFGITCDNGKIVEVSLKNNGLVGNIPAALGLLNPLGFFYVGGNNLTCIQNGFNLNVAGECILGPNPWDCNNPNCFKNWHSNCDNPCTSKYPCIPIDSGPQFNIVGNLPSTTISSRGDLNVSTRSYYVSERFELMPSQGYFFVSGISRAERLCPSASLFPNASPSFLLRLCSRYSNNSQSVIEILTVKFYNRVGMELSVSYDTGNLEFPLSYLTDDAILDRDISILCPVPPSAFYGEFVFEAYNPFGEEFQIYFYLGVGQCRSLTSPPTPTSRPTHTPTPRPTPTRTPTPPSTSRSTSKSTPRSTPTSLPS